jgi:hypothetical protein
MSDPLVVIGNERPRGAGELVFIRSREPIEFLRDDPALGRALALRAAA